MTEGKRKYRRDSLYRAQWGVASGGLSGTGLCLIQAAPAAAGWVLITVTWVLVILEIARRQQ
jgi:hypothetical protein